VRTFLSSPQHTRRDNASVVGATSKHKPHQFLEAVVVIAFTALIADNGLVALDFQLTHATTTRGTAVDGIITQALWA
jgi:hypothetical protein